MTRTNWPSIFGGKAGGLSPIGLDIGSNRVKAAQLRRTSSGWKLHAFASVPRESIVPEGTTIAGNVSEQTTILTQRGS